MAFIQKNFGPLGGQSTKGIGGAPAAWVYKTADTHATVDTTGYFDAVRNILSIGDLIYVAVVTNLGATNEALSTAGWHVVKDKPALGAAGIDVTDVTALTVTDTD
jgi:hypothetical protein